MTTINPLGTETFYVNVFEDGELGCHWPSFPVDNPDAVYRIKVRPWMPHDGGPCPVAPHVRVRVKTGCGSILEGPSPAGFWSACDALPGDYWSGAGGVDPADAIRFYQIIED